MSRIIAWTLLLAGLTPALARGAEPRLAERLDVETGARVLALADSARGESLPPEPLIQRALEGATKGAPNDLIVRAVHALLNRLRLGKKALGPAASEAELTAAADALYAGVDTTTIAAMRRARPKGSTAVGLVVLSDLIGRGVPRARAAAAVVAMMDRGTQDGALLKVRRGVEQDILAGDTPSAAMTSRLQGTVPDWGPPAPGRRSEAP